MPKNLTASMSGTVWRVLVEVGQTVNEGDEIVILESMKMEIPHPAPASGKVVEIKALPQTFVNEGDTILVIEQT
jgi:acetyl-CoA carboxylase biotin carboxyl carrier protein